MAKKADLTHVHAFTAATERKDIDGMLAHFDDRIVLRTPLVAEPIEGKSAVRPIVEALLRVVDAFEFREILLGPEHVASFFVATAGANRLDGVDYWRLGDDGLIREMTVLWRPLPDIVAVQTRLAA